MPDILPAWVMEAATWPVAFAQVREDPRIDQFVVERAGAAARVCMVASGGCTAAVLATMPNVAAIHLVDANPAQLALSRLKLRLLETADEQTRLALLGHETLGSPWSELSERTARLTDELSALGLPAN